MLKVQYFIPFSLHSEVERNIFWCSYDI